MKHLEVTESLLFLGHRGSEESPSLKSCINKERERKGRVVAAGTNNWQNVVGIVPDKIDSPLNTISIADGQTD